MIKTAHVDRVRVHLASEHLAVDGVDRQVVGGVGGHHTPNEAKVQVEREKKINTKNVRVRKTNQSQEAQSPDQVRYKNGQGNKLEMS